MLKSRGEFRSYIGGEVLPELEAFVLQCRTLKKTADLYIIPVEVADGEAAACLSDLVSWMDWVKGAVGR